MQNKQSEVDQSGRPRLWDTFRAEKIVSDPTVRAFGVRLFKD